MSGCVYNVVQWYMFEVDIFMCVLIIVVKPFFFLLFES
jgi:hypothetical protein